VLGQGCTLVSGEICPFSFICGVGESVNRTAPQGVTAIGDSRLEFGRSQGEGVIPGVEEVEAGVMPRRGVKLSPCLLIEVGVLACDILPACSGESLRRTGSDVLRPAVSSLAEWSKRAREVKP